MAPETVAAQRINGYWLGDAKKTFWWPKTVKNLSYFLFGNKSSDYFDALHLADNLTNGQFNSLEAAIQSYERAMYTYAHEAQEGTAEAELNIHSAKSDAELLAERDAWNRTL